MDQNELNEILRKHQLWLDGKEGGERANLMDANLKAANLKAANLKAANLEGANLTFANLAFANLAFANLKWANIWGANFKNTNLAYANLVNSNFSGRKAIHLDKTRNYILYVLPEVLGGPRFIAGCRNFTYSEAIEHWKTKSNQPEYVKAIKNYMESKNANN